jgi:2,5-furandicarboxylate decarboxylase 1
MSNRYKAGGRRLPFRAANRRVRSTDSARAIVDGNLDGDKQSRRGFLRLVESEFPEELLRVRQPIDLKFEPTALVFELERMGRSPVVLFENVGDRGMPMVTNVAANRRLLAACLGVEPGDLPTAFRERCQTYLPCQLVERGEWEDVVIEGDDVDLTKLPIPLQFAVDAAPYITAGQVVARDPVTGVDTSGFHRLMLKGKNRLGVSLHSRRRMYEFHRRAEERGQSLPAAVTLGVHPLHYMGSMVYAYPPQVRKFEIIGGLFGEPYRLARCGIADLELPAGAEIVLEGEILAHVREPEGPFSEFTGYASYRSTQNVFVVHRIRMRRDAMFHSVTSGMSRDHILISCITREGEILNALRRNLPNVKAVHVPHTTCGAFMAFISMKKTADGEPQMAVMATLGTELYTKYVVVVDDDVDIFDMDDVMWAIATRVRAEKDIFFIPGMKGAILDPTSDPQNFTLTKMGIDATRPSGQDFAERLAISEDQRARARSILQAAGIQS